jgi:hypothetical protein
VARPVELDELDREQLLAHCRQLTYRHKAMVFFLKRMHIWGEYKGWLLAMNSRISD